MDTKVNETERGKAYITLSEHLYKQFNDRRTLEWKVNFALWTLLVAIGYVIITNHIQLHIRSLMLFCAVPLHAVWCIKTHRSLAREKRLSISYRKAAELILSTAGNQDTIIAPIDDKIYRATISNRFIRSFDGYWWWFGTYLVTTYLIVSFVVYLAW